MEILNLESVWFEMSKFWLGLVEKEKKENENGNFERI